LLRCFWELWEETLPGDTPVLSVSRFSREARPRGGVVLLRLATRATRIFHALVELAWSGFAIETGALARMLFETTLDIHWASANQDVMVKRFRQHERLTAYLWYQRWAKYPGWWDTPGRPDPPPDLEELHKLFGQHAERHWSGVGIRKRVEQAERLVDDPYQLRLIFDIVHSGGSEVIHSTSQSLKQIGGLASEPGVLRLDYGPSPFVMGAHLAPAFWCYAQVLKLIFREFDVNTRDELEALIEYQERRLAVNLPDLWPDVD
jgi:hypothetical protein